MTQLVDSDRDVVGTPRRRAAHAASRTRHRLGWGSLTFPVSAFVASRCLLILLALAVPATGHGSLRWLSRVLNAGDAGWYLTIARGGYLHRPYHLVDGQVNWPFFPLFPVASRWTAEVTGLPVFWVGVVLANACFLMFAIVVFRWVARDWSVRAARSTVALACFSPLTAYFMGFRATSVFLLLTTVALERMVHRRMGQAALVGALATLARPTGVVLVLPYLVAAARLLSRRDTRRSGIAALAGASLLAAGPLVMAWISEADSGNPLAFLQAQSFWGRSFALPFAPFVSFVHSPTWTSDFGWASPPVALAAAVLGVIGAAYLWKRRVPSELPSYLVAMVLLGSASTVLVGYPRFIAEAMPIYLAGGVAPRWVARALVVMSVVGMVAYTVLWLRGADWTMG